MRRFLVALLLFVCATAQAETGLNTYLGTDGILKVSYSLKGEDVDAFFEQVTDALKSGKKITVRHYVTLKEKGLFGDTLAENMQDISLSYDVLQNMYVYNHGYSSNPDLIKGYVLSRVDMPLEASEKLVTGDSYKIVVSVTLEKTVEDGAQNGWEKWLGKVPVPSFTRKKLTHEVSYIAR